MAKPFFTKENASFYAAKSADVRRQTIEEAKLAIETASLDPAIDYSQRRLARVRLQLDNVDNDIAIESKSGDSKRLKELCEAQARLNAQERELSMRPAPGTTKPPTQRSTKASAFNPPPPADDVPLG